MHAKPRIPKVGDIVGRMGSKSVYVVTRANEDGTEADIFLNGTDLERFRVPVSTLTIPNKT